MKPVRTILSVVLLFCLAAVGWSAQPVVETFTAGANGWIGSAPLGGATWSFTGGAARVTFSTIPFGVPYEGVLSNSVSASSGSITGNYDQAAVTLIGFRFMAPTHIPSSVSLEWGSGTSVFQRGFSVIQTGIWYSFSVPMANELRNEWTPIGLTSLDDFAAARQAVSYVAIRVIRNGTSQRQYVIDDIFLASQPSFGPLGMTSGTSSYFRADSLQLSHAYEVESSTEVTGTWAITQSFIATNAMQWVEVTNSGPQQYWRLINP